MTCEQFYEEMKRALDYLGVGFHGMHLVTVSSANGEFILSYGNKSIAIKVSP